jgi:divalent metal cation (Fe/Co/Zn/Cd) transporter
VSHLRAADGTVLCDHIAEHAEPSPTAAASGTGRLGPDDRDDAHGHDHAHHHDHLHHHDHPHGHDHSHGLVDRSILRSRAGVKAVALSLLILGATAGAQVAVFVFSSSVALLADLIHNAGDALTAVPLGIAFFLRSVRGERIGGLGVVLAIFVSACVALYETVLRFIHPQHLTHLGVLAAAGVIGFVGNELAAQVRLSAGRRLASAALVADGKHARIDGFVSLGVVASAVAVALGAQIADPVIGLAITLTILRITWQAWREVRDAEIDLEHVDGEHGRT